jgi:methylenetetrahydrofolate--tRNA-(uracil-5-)-methyltransferase
MSKGTPVTVTVVGGGLAGCEAAWQIARRGHPVRLFEMRPMRPTAAHRTDRLAELVCSNSFKSNRMDSASGLLKEEMRRCDSLILEKADAAQVPAGSALAVDREQFAAGVTEAIEGHSHIELIREEVSEIPAEGPTVIATGPLVSDGLADAIGRFTGRKHLYFFDAVSPIVEAESIDRSVAFAGSRYGKGGDDYWNCPMDETAYAAFLEALLAAEAHPAKEFENIPFFEGCVPVEELARRGPDTLRFGPMRPVGLDHPRTGRRPHAVVQLRQDNLAASHYSLVGFQTSLRWGEQERVFRMIPGLGNAEFVRLGMIHRNSYINAPAILLPTLQTRKRKNLFFAGQISGVEGYLESAASGLVAGINAACLVDSREPVVFPRTTALGALLRYVSAADPTRYQPANIAFGLLPAPEIRNRKQRQQAMIERALADLKLTIAERL